MEVAHCFGMSGSLETDKMFWDVGKSRDGDLSEIENFVRKKGEEQTSPTMGPERKKERKTKECGKVQIVSTKINAWEFMT